MKIDLKRAWLDAPSNFRYEYPPPIFFLDGVLWMKSLHRVSMTAQLFALHDILVLCMAQCKALVMEDALRRNKYGAAV